jgi:hypothetical protein
MHTIGIIFYLVLLLAAPLFSQEIQAVPEDSLAMLDHPVDLVVSTDVKIIT